MATVAYTPRHSALLTVPITIAGTTVHTVINIVASAPVVGKAITCKMGIGKRAKTVHVHQVDKTKVKGSKYMVNSSFTVPTMQLNSMQVNVIQNDII